MTNQPTEVPPGARWAGKEVPIQPPGLGSANRAAPVVAQPESLIRPVERTPVKSVFKGAVALIAIVGVGAGAVFGLKAVTKEKPAASEASEDAEATEADDAGVTADDVAEDPIGAATDVVAQANEGTDPLAQIDVRNAMMAAMVIYTDYESFAPVTAEQLELVEPSLTYMPLDAVDANSVGYATFGDTQVLLVRQSGSGTWFCVGLDAMADTTYGKGAELAAVDSMEECAAPGW